MLIIRAEVEGRAPLDVRVENGCITELAPDLRPRAEEEILDAEGGALLPGLHDHHLHLLALAAAGASVICGPPEVTDAAALRRALATAQPVRGWIRGVGYHECVAGSLDRSILDALGPTHPVRVQHRSGALWMLNSAAVAALGLDAGADLPGVERDLAGRPTGRLFRLDAWLRERMGSAEPPDLRPVAEALLSVGVTGVTDATQGNGAQELGILEAAVSSGSLPQRIMVMGGPDLPAPRLPRMTRGALKIVLDERTPSDPDSLAERLSASHASERAVAVHCVTRAELVMALAAFEKAGVLAGDRLEHASVAPPELALLAARLGLLVVTQPGFLFERGDAYLDDVDPRDQPWLYRGNAWLQAGVALGGGTDAPFGAADPWLAMRAAVERRSRGGRVLGAAEALSPERALALFTTEPGAPGGPPRRVRVGAVADLCLLHEPWCVARCKLSKELVAQVLCGGERSSC